MYIKSARGRGLTCGIVLSMIGRVWGADDRWMPTIMWQFPLMESPDWGKTHHNQSVSNHGRGQTV